MKFAFAFVLVILIFDVSFSSCRYSMPLLKSEYRVSSEVDSLTKAITKSTHYRYPRISRYGFVGWCSEDSIYDSTGVLTEIRISKISAIVCDGNAVHVWNEKYIDASGKITRKKKSILREKGWSTPKTRERTIEYDSNGKRKVTKK